MTLFYCVLTKLYCQNIKGPIISRRCNDDLCLLVMFSIVVINQRGLDAVSRPHSESTETVLWEFKLQIFKLDNMRSCQACQQI